MSEPISEIHKYEFVIAADVIDRNGHVNNVAYVKWMQDAAVAHTQAVMDGRSYRDEEHTWVARSHHIEYLKPAFLDETIEVRTWLTGFRKVRCQRKYEFVRTSDNRLVAQGETDWVYISIANGLPRSIPEAIRDLFSKTDSQKNE